MQRQKRGVYRAWFSMDGHPVYYAVTAAGEILPKCAVIRPGKDELREVGRLRALLDRLDPPRPPLALVKDEPPTRGPKQITIERLDELYRNADRLSLYLYRRKRASLRGQIRSFQ